MPIIPYTPQISRYQSVTSHGHTCVMHYLRLTFINGPKKLLTSRISGKCAALMAMMCSPSLLLFSLLTIPGLIFQNPQQNAYFYFSKLVNQDPTRWIVLSLAAICALMSMAVPAAMAEPLDAPAGH